jgi:hypothetical protein
MGVMRRRKGERHVELCGFMKRKKCYFSILFCSTLYVDFIELISRIRMD